MSTQRGKLIVIEGTDGSGKETQSKMLIDRLNAEDFPTKTISFPRYHTPTGRIVGQSYLGKDTRVYGWKGDTGWFGDPDKVDPKIASLYYAADRVAATPEILDILNSGANLILDRYYQSNMAHQGGKMRQDAERTRIMEFIWRLETETLHIPKEDGLIFLYMPVQVTQELRSRREKERNERPDGHEASSQHLKHAEETYLALMQQYNFINKYRQVDCTLNGTIQTLRTPENISDEVYKHALELINPNL